MTLCVAAECVHKGEGRFVFAKDFAVETEISSAEIEAKWTHIGKAEFPALMAGSGSRALELAGLIGDRLDSDASDDETLIQIARSGVKEFKYKLADEYVGSRLGIGYDKFLAEGAQILPAETHREMFDVISAITLGCSLLWLPFDADNSTIIMRINDSGLVERCSNFAAIGSGMYIAEAALFQREQSNEKSLGDTIYHVYEAMKLGAAAPGVGENFSLHIVSAPTSSSGQIKLQWVTEDYDKYLDRMFERFGPKKTSGIKFRSRAVKLNRFTASGVPVDD
jgi:hypothetical protein